MDEVAKIMGMSGRTLRRRLAGLGTSYQAELDSVRKELALDCLASNQSMTRIAETLGFNDSSAFHKAFKRWTGMTPSEYRSKAKVGSFYPVMDQAS